MSETPLFFAHNDQRMFAILHAPEVDLKKMGWVFCHPFAEEKLWAHRVYVNLARKLADRGYTVLRFDYRGYGDSEGDFEDFSIDDQLADINRAINLLSEKHPQLESVGLLGLRYGALLAALVAENNEQVNHLVLWDPITDMSSYLQEILRSNLTTQLVMYGKVITNRKELTQQILNNEAVNVDGYNLTRYYYDSANSINLMNDEKTFSGKCQIVQIGRANQPLKKNIEKFASLYKNVDIFQAEEEQFWKEIKNFIQRSESLEKHLLTWLGENEHV